MSHDSGLAFPDNSTGLARIPSPSIAPHALDSDFPPVVLAPQRTLIAFAGLAGSGKSTAADYLVNRYGFCRMRFAGPLKAMMGALGLTPDEIDGPLKEKPCALLGGRTPRHAMQTIGTDWGRDMIDPDLWVRAWQAALPVSGNVVVDDCRFPNEAAAISAAGGILVRIERTGAGNGAAGHSSENQDLPAALVVQNNSSMNDLFLAIDRLLRDFSWREPVTLR